jgi:hypothetical protein
MDAALTAYEQAGARDPKDAKYRAIRDALCGKLAN